MPLDAFRPADATALTFQNFDQLTSSLLSTARDDGDDGDGRENKSQARVPFAREMPSGLSR